MKKYFVFIDESGANQQENIFALGCLFVPVESIGDYYNLLNKVRSKIITKVKNREGELEKVLSRDDLINFYKGRKKAYEMKFKNVNATTSEGYEWFLSQYFKFSDVRFCSLVIDKSKYPAPDGMSFYDVYINQLSMLLKNNVEENEEIVLLPDDISLSSKDSHYERDINEKLSKCGKSIFGTHRLESHSSLFIQLVDVLTGAVLFDFKGGQNLEKQKVVQKIKSKTGIQSFLTSKTINNPNYFSNWVYQKK